MKSKDVLYLVGIGAILILLIYILFGKTDSIPDIVYNYKTDTIYVDRPYEVPVPYEVPTPPKVVKVYLVDSTSIDSLSMIIKDKDLIIFKLRDSILISEYYFKQFPKNPKLLSLGLSKDSLNISLLNIGGNVNSFNWPINLTYFDYRWDYENNLTRSVHKVSNYGPSFNYYIGMGLDIPRTSPFITNQLEITNRKIKVFTSADIGLLDIKSSNFKFGIGYSIYGKNNIRIGKRNNF